MRKLDKLAQEKFSGNVREALKYTMQYYSKAEINKYWHEWTEEEQKYAAMVERELPKRRYIREFIYRLLCLICVPFGIGAMVLVAVVFYKYGAIFGILTAIAEIGIIALIFKSKVKYTDFILGAIVVTLVIVSLIVLVLSEAIREYIILGIESLCGIK